MRGFILAFCTGITRAGAGGVADLLSGDTGLTCGNGVGLEVLAACIFDGCLRFRLLHLRFLQDDNLRVCL